MLQKNCTENKCSKKIALKINHPKNGEGGCDHSDLDSASQYNAVVPNAPYYYSN